MTLELHLTYHCNLSCPYCNRGVRLRTDHTPDITVEQWRHVLATAPRKITRIVLIGGEPTLRPDICDFIDAAREIAGDDVQFAIYSNAYSERSRLMLKLLDDKYGIKNTGGTEKPNGNVLHLDKDCFISPADFGYNRQIACNWAASEHGCGYSVDGGGITACSIGGSIDGILKLDVRTWNWAEVDNSQLLKLCHHCGHRWQFKPEELAQLTEYRDQKISKTWAEAMNGFSCVSE